MKRFFSLFICLLLITLVACDGKITNVDGLLINEVCTSNDNVICNDEWDYYDYVELYNSTNKSINLKKFTIATDDHSYKFKNCIIKPKGFQIVFFTKDMVTDKKFEYADFKLSKSGENIKLYRPDGTLTDEIKVPSLETNVSYGRYNINGRDDLEIINPSPLKANETKPIYKYIESPDFSLESGFYKSNQTLTLSSSSDVKIYYTLDSSVPTKDSILYTEPIDIRNIDENDFVIKSRTDLCEEGNRYRGPNYDDKCMVVRAIAISEDGNQSDVITKSYFVNNKRFDEDTTVISLVTDPANLVDNEKGIYITGDSYDKWVAGGSVGIAPLCNFDQKGREWERECNFAMFEDGNLSFSQDCGMRVKGYGGRSHVIKSFNLYARSCYGESHFVDPIFDDVSYTDSFSLKHDRYTYGSRAEKVRDGFVQSLVSDRNVSTQDYVNCVVFLDGEYWETYMIMEKYSDDYIENHYGVNKDDVVMIKEGDLEEGVQDDAKLYAEITRFVTSTNLKSKKNYEKFKEMVDIQSLIDFYAIQVYVNNYDFSYKKNTVLWRSRSKNGTGYNDGKWRWMLYDMDMVAIDRKLQDTSGNVENYDYTFNPFTGRFLWATDLKDDIFINNLIKNEEFKEQFVTTFMDIANENLNKDRVIDLLKSKHNIYSGDMFNFFSHRLETIPGYLKEYASLEGDLKRIIINSTKDIELNTISPTLNSNVWTGYYFTDYPLVLKGNLENVNFSGIKVISQTDTELVFKLTGESFIEIR